MMLNIKLFLQKFATIIRHTIPTLPKNCSPPTKGENLTKAVQKEIREDRLDRFFL